MFTNEPHFEKIFVSFWKGSIKQYNHDIFRFSVFSYSRQKSKLLSLNNQFYSSLYFLYLFSVFCFYFFNVLCQRVPFCKSKLWRSLHLKSQCLQSESDPQKWKTNTFLTASRGENNEGLIMINPKANSVQPTALTQYRFNYFSSFIMHVVAVQWNFKKKSQWWNDFWSLGKWLSVKLEGTPRIDWFLKVLFSGVSVEPRTKEGYSRLYMQQSHGVLIVPSQIVLQSVSTFLWFFSCLFLTCYWSPGIYGVPDFLPDYWSLTVFVLEPFYLTKFYHFQIHVETDCWCLPLLK